MTVALASCGYMRRVMVVQSMMGVGPSITASSETLPETGTVLPPSAPPGLVPPKITKSVRSTTATVEKQTKASQASVPQISSVTNNVPELLGGNTTPRVTGPTIQKPKK